MPESDNPEWKLKMAHNFLRRSIFNDGHGYEEILMDEMGEKTSSNSESGGNKETTEQDSSVKKVGSGYSNLCVTCF